MTERINMIFNGIERRVWNLQTHTPRQFGWDDRTFTLNVYQYQHDYKKLYKEFELDPRVKLAPYQAPYFEQALYKGIPMRYRYNPTIRSMMMTGNFRIKYRGVSKAAYGYKRPQNYIHAEYADTFAIYPK
tara:strand:- start:204 stop:593 length:390 start_codon:yes stop_codon:yes gene_type:complete